MTAHFLGFDALQREVARISQDVVNLKFPLPLVVLEKKNK
jgi:hypothetical protein